MSQDPKKLLTIQKKLLATLEELGFFTDETLERLAAGKLTRPQISALVENTLASLFPAPNEALHKYVVGIAVDPDRTHGLFVLKNRPVWQAGFLNGVGGKIEDGESPAEAMVREFYEETKIRTDFTDDEDEPTWRYVGQRFREAQTPLQDGSYELHIFVVELPLEVMKKADATSQKLWKKNKNHEQIHCLPLNLEILRRRGVPGLAALVDLSICSLTEPFAVKIEDAPIHLPFSDD